MTEQALNKAAREAEIRKVALAADKERKYQDRLKLEEKLDNDRIRKEYEL